MARKKKGKGKGKGKLRLVPTQCEATTRDGKRCKRKATKNGACGLKAHQDQVLGRKNVERREPAKHEAQCMACAHPELARAEDLWITGGLSDGEAAEMLEITERGWQRHAHYMDLYEKRAKKGLLPYLSRIMDRALHGDPKMASGVAAARLAHTIVQGGQKVIIETYERLKEEERAEFFAAIESLLDIDEEMKPARFIELLRSRLASPPAPDEEGRVH